MGTRTNLIRVAQVPVMAAVGAGAGDDARTTVRDDAFVLEVEGATRRAVQNPFSPAAGAGLVGTPREHPRGCPGPSTGGARRASRGTSVATLIAAVALLCVKMLAVDQQPRAAVRGGLFQALMQREVLPHHAARQELIFGSLRNSLLATGPTNSTVHTAPASRSDEGNTAREKALHARELEEQADEEKALAKEEAARQEAHAVVEKWEGKQQADEEKALAKEESARKMAHEVVEKWEGKSAAATGQRAVPPRSPLIVNASHKHDATPRLPLLPTSRDELLTEARSVERTLARDGRYVLRSAELEGRMVAEQLLVSQFQPRWLRGRGGGDATNVTGLHAANGTGSGRGAKSVLRRPQPAPADVMDPDVKEFMHEFRHGVENSNSSAYQDIVIADRMVTEPDDIVKIEDEVRRQAKERRKRAELVHEQSKNRTHELPGAFRWFQDDDEKLIDNATNLTYGTWVWCKNDTYFDAVHWKNGSIIGAPVMRAHEQFIFVKRCVSVSGPGFLDHDAEDDEEEAAKARQKVEQDEISELRKRNWDEPFMTYEPHPSSVGWDKSHWKESDWLSWGFTGPVLSILFTSFVAVTFGWLPGLGVGLTCVVADTATYYWNW